MTGHCFDAPATTLVGQSLGKFRSDLADIYSKYAQICGFIATTLLAAVFFFFGDVLISFFADDPEVIRSGSMVLKLMAFDLPLQTIQFIAVGTLKGAGDTKFNAMTSMITVMIIRPGFAYIFIDVLDIGLIGAWLALCCDQIVRTTLVCWRQSRRTWMLTSFKLK